MTITAQDPAAIAETASAVKPLTRTGADGVVPTAALPDAHGAASVASRTALVIERASDRTQWFTEFYRDLHRNPELSFEEVRTASKLAGVLRGAGFDVTEGVGRTGVVGILRNGEGPTVLLRGDMDALPVTEATGLAYASAARGVTPNGEEVGVMHACGHDMHVAALAASAEALAKARDTWSGTLMIVGQPAEELIAGAAAMLDDGIYERFGTPDVVLGHHVGGTPAGTVTHAPGVIMSATTKIDITIHGKGGHGSAPHLSIDPITTAAHIITRLQTFVAREVDPATPVVVTVGRVWAGTKANIIPDDALLQLSVRATDSEVLMWANDRVRAIAVAECAATGCATPPTIEVVMAARETVNDAAVHDAVTAAHREVFGAGNVWRQQSMLMGSEDFGAFGGYHGGWTEELIPTHFWFLGGMSRELWGADADETTTPPDTLPPGHSSTFAPLLAETLEAGRLSLVSAALVYL